MSAALLTRAARTAEERATRRREAIAADLRAADIDAQVEGDAVRLTGPGLMRRWMSDLTLRERGRGRP